MLRLSIYQTRANCTVWQMPGNYPSCSLQAFSMVVKRVFSWVEQISEGSWFDLDKTQIVDASPKLILIN